MRGLNATETTLDDFMLPGLGRGSLRVYLLSLPPTAWQSQHPVTIEVHPLKTKTYAMNPYSISLPRAPNHLLDVWFWLLAVYLSSAPIGRPIQQYLIRTTQPSQPALEQPFSRSGLHDRLRKHLKQLGSYGGESMHSFRRGMAQHCAAQGQDLSLIKQTMLLKTDAILKGRHLASGRHVTGVKRLRHGVGEDTAAKL